jgi:hypothetical protein
LATSISRDGKGSREWLVYLLAVSALSAFLIAVFELTVHVRFETNDDVAMELLCSGFGFAVRPDAHMLFSHIWLGKVLAALYTWNGDVRWYPIYLQAAGAVAFATIGFCFLIKHKFWVGLLASLLFFLASAVTCFVVMQFTATACLVTLAGVAIAFTIADAEELTCRQNIFLSVLGMALLMLASLIRFEGFELILAFGLLLSILRRIPKPLLQKRVILPISVLVAAGIFGLTAAEFQKAAYRNDPNWNGFFSILRATADFTDFQKGNYVVNNAPLLKQVNWSANDVHMLEIWGYMDANVFSLEKVNEVRRQLPTSTISLQKVGSQLFGLLGDPTLFAIYAVIAPFLFVMDARRMGLARYAALCLASSGILCVLIACFKSSWHVYLPVFSFLLWACLFHIDAARVATALSSAWRQRRVAFCLLIVVLGLAYGFWVQKVYAEPFRNISRMNHILKDSIKALNPNKHTLYVCWGTAFPFEYILPFDSLSFYFKNLSFLPIGCQSRAPTFGQMLALYNIKDFFSGLLQPNVVLLSYDFNNKILEQYMLEHYGLTVKANVLAGYFPDGRLTLYKVVRVAAQ